MATTNVADGSSDDLSREDQESGMPTLDEFMTMVKREDSEISQRPSAYSVYHKYNKSS